MPSYGANIFEIGPKSKSIVVKQTVGTLSTHHKDFNVMNIGRTPIKAELLYGTSVTWLGTLHPPVQIKPSGSKVIKVAKNLYYITAVRISNDSPVRALVHCGKVDGTDWSSGPKSPLKLDITSIANILVKYGPGAVPVVGDKLHPIIDYFWPQLESIWNLTLDAEYELNEKTQVDIQQLKEKLVNFNINLEYPNNSHILPFQFMQLIEDTIGFEKKFIFNPDAANAQFFNYMFLPYYSSIITLKLSLYQFGIINRLKLGLLDEQVRRLLLLSKQLIEGKPEGALSYIARIYRKLFNQQYASCDPQQIYETLATVRTCCGVAGFEFFPYWNGIVANPHWKKKSYTDVIVYSTYFGRLSPLLSKQLVIEDVEEPLQPKLNSNGMRNKLTRIDVYLWKKGYKTSPKIGGISVLFQNGQVCQLGGRSQEVTTIDFKGSNLDKLIVWGDNCIDFVEFIFSDGRKETCGSKDKIDGTYFTFELEHHHIAGIFLANDVPSLQGQAANIAVSFQLVSEN